MRLAILLCAMLLWPAAARAEWLEASSAHFVVYADDSEKNVRRYAAMLERYHAAMELVTRHKTPPLSPSNRLTVFVVKSDKEVRQLAKSDDSSLEAFYLPRAGGSLAIVPPLEDVANQDDDDDRDDETENGLLPLLHEYAHHFLISTTAFPMPRWFSEGAAEFFATARFNKDGGVGLGRSSATRLFELQFASRIVVRDLLDTTKDDGLGGSYVGFYAKSWQLYHYLIFEPARQGQLARYMAEMTAGQSSRDAALHAFGDFAKLDQELAEYAKRPKTSFFAVPPAGIRPGRIDVARLGKGDAAIMPIRIRLRVGVDADEAKGLLEEARRIAARFPAEPGVLSTLAACEYDAGNDNAALAAADAALAADPAQVDAYVQRGLALYRIAEGADDATEAFERARAAFAALNEREPDHPIPLAYFFRIYVAQGKPPPPSAVQGLERAVELAPFDLGLRLNLALQQARTGQLAAARANLLPIAHNPHGDDLKAEARTALARLNAVLGPQGGGSPEAKQIPVSAASEKSPAGPSSLSASRSQPDGAPTPAH